MLNKKVYIGELKLLNKKYDCLVSNKNRLIEYSILNIFLNNKNFNISLLNDKIYSKIQKPQKINNKIYINCELFTNICKFIYFNQNFHESINKLAEMFFISFCKVGLISVIDEATGYQNFREKNELMLITKKSIEKRRIL